MAYQVKNVYLPAPNGLWRHIATDTLLLVIELRGLIAECAIMDGPKVSRRRVEIPIKKMKSYGNRGFEYQLKRKGKVPVVSKNPGLYDPRLKDLGAM